MKYKTTDYVVYNDKAYRVLGVEKASPPIGEIIYKIRLPEFKSDDTWIRESDINHEKTKEIQKIILDRGVTLNLDPAEISFLMSTLELRIERIQEQRNVFINSKLKADGFIERIDRQLREIDLLQQKIKEQLHEQQLLQNKKVMP